MNRPSEGLEIPSDFFSQMIPDTCDQDFDLLSEARSGPIKYPPWHRRSGYPQNLVQWTCLELSVAPDRWGKSTTENEGGTLSAELARSKILHFTDGETAS